MAYVRFTVHQYNGYAEDRMFCSAERDIIRALQDAWTKAGQPALPTKLRGLNITLHSFTDAPGEA